MNLSKTKTEGRGAQINTHNKFMAQSYEAEDYYDEDFPPARIKTIFYEENAKNADKNCSKIFFFSGLTCTLAINSHFNLCRAL